MCPKKKNVATLRSAISVDLEKSVILALKFLKPYLQDSGC